MCRNTYAARVTHQMIGPSVVGGRGRYRHPAHHPLRDVRTAPQGALRHAESQSTSRITIKNLAFALTGCDSDASDGIVAVESPNRGH
eukprot:3015213-Pyramimonas_sp.AAC.1